MLRRLPLAAAAVAAAVALAAAPGSARAETEWYGYEVAGTDVAGWALIIGGAKLDVWQVSAIGAGALFLGGPIVHAAHENYGRAGVSFGLRVGGPLLGFGIGAGLDRNSRSFIPAGPILGAFVGYVVGAVVDIAVVAREEKDPAATPRMLSFGGRF